MEEHKEIYKEMCQKIWKLVSDCGQWGDQYAFEVIMNTENDDHIKFCGGTTDMDDFNIDYDEDRFKADGGKW